MTYISNILFWISTGLLVPVIVILIFLFLRSLLLAGGFFGEYIAMRRVRRSLELGLRGGGVDFETLVGELPSEAPQDIGSYVARIVDAGGDEAETNKALADFEALTASRLFLPNMLSKLGPTIGLMGTLIPMGPALVGLSTGDIASMAYNMQVAFATTVVGLCSAMIGYIILNIRRRWYTRQMSQLEYVADLMAEKGGVK